VAGRLGRVNNLVCPIQDTFGLVAPGCCWEGVQVATAISLLFRAGAGESSRPIFTASKALRSRQFRLVTTLGASSQTGHGVKVGPLGLNDINPK
jgi:hypothetical protein